MKKYLSPILKSADHYFSVKRIGQVLFAGWVLHPLGLQLALLCHSQTAISETNALPSHESNTVNQSSLAIDNQKPWIRVNSEVSQLKFNEKKQLLAFVESAGNNLRILNLSNGETYLVTSEYVGNSFFWAPDHTRLIFTSAAKTKDGSRTKLAAFDMGNKKVVNIDEIQGETGSVSFDPRDNKFFLMHRKGVITKELLMNESRLAKWQSRKVPKSGRFIATPGGIAFMKENGSGLGTLKDDNSGVESFEISADGTNIVWATKSGKIFYSEMGAEPIFMDYGRDPKWHPSRKILLYSGAHRVGRLNSGFDLKISDLEGKKTWLTSDSYARQRWPVWLPKANKILYTKDSTTDLYLMDFKL